MKKVIQLTKDKINLYEQVVDMMFRNFPSQSVVQDMYLGQVFYPERITALVDKDKVLGGLKMGFNEVRGVVTLDFLVVSEAHRGEGLGTQLLSGFESYLVSRGVNNVGLQSRLNPAVMKFYRKQGYVDVEGYLPQWMEKKLV